MSPIQGSFRRFRTVRALSYHQIFLVGNSYISLKDLSIIAKPDAAQMGPTPTSIEGMRLGMGHAVEVDTYRIGKMGPHKDGRVQVDPAGKKAWLEAEVTKWGWQRDPGWTLGVSSS